MKIVCQAFLLVFVYLGFSCTQSKKPNEQLTSTSREENLIDIEIINQIINPLLDSNKFFFYPEGHLGEPISNDSVKFGLKIRPLLDSIKNCTPEQVLNIEDVHISQPFVVTKKDDISEFILLNISRICFIDENRAFFYTTFYRDADFSRDDKVIIKRMDDVWVIQDIITLSIS